MNSTLWIPDSIYWISSYFSFELGSGFLKRYFCFRSLGFPNSKAKIGWILESFTWRDDRITWKLTLQDINTTPIEPKTERGVVAVNSFFAIIVALEHGATTEKTKKLYWENALSRKDDRTAVSFRPRDTRHNLATRDHKTSTHARSQQHIIWNV